MTNGISLIPNGVLGFSTGNEYIRQFNELYFLSDPELVILLSATLDFFISSYFRWWLIAPGYRVLTL